MVHLIINRNVVPHSLLTIRFFSYLLLLSPHWMLFSFSSVSSKIAFIVSLDSSRYARASNAHTHTDTHHTVTDIKSFIWWRTKLIRIKTNKMCYVRNKIEEEEEEEKRHHHMDVFDIISHSTSRTIPCLRFHIHLLLLHVSAAMQIHIFDTWEVIQI